MITLSLLIGLMLLTGLSEGSSSPVRVTRDLFGYHEVPEHGGTKLPVYRYTLSNGNMEVQVMEYGATLMAVKVPDRHGKQADVVLGFDTLEGYLSSDNPRCGATMGRVVNRVGGGQFTLDGVTYHLYTAKNRTYSIFGGLRGFHKKLWSSHIEQDQVVFNYTSVDTEEGYPGTVDVRVHYRLAEDNTLVMEFRAYSDKRTPINLANHAYFNLAGHNAGPQALDNHMVFIRANQITELDEQLIPTGKLKNVEGTEFDFTKAKRFGDAFKLTPNDGFDINFVLPQKRENIPVVVVEEPLSGRRLEVETTQPGVQIYTGNFFKSILGKEESYYTRHAGFNIEAQNFPDAINHPAEFPNSVYGPLDVYYQITKYKFGLAEKKG